MKEDVCRWNTKYSAHQATTEIRPDAILEEHQALLSGRGIALDLAAGKCDNALYLASCGYTTVAIDGSHVALELGLYKAEANGLRLNCIVADLDSYPLPTNRFNVITVIKYLNRSLVDSIRSSLNRSGVIFFKTFNEHFLEEKPSFPKEYVLRHGELADWFRDWQCVKTNDTWSNKAVESYWIGRKP